MHDELLTLLSETSDLKVISRTSVEHLDPNLSIPQIGALLGVATVLEGQVQRAGNRLRINMQLIDANRKGHLWATTYDREMYAGNPGKNVQYSEKIRQIDPSSVSGYVSALQAYLWLGRYGLAWYRQTQPATMHGYQTTIVDLSLLALSGDGTAALEALREAVEQGWKYEWRCPIWVSLICAGMTCSRKLIHNSLRDTQLFLRTQALL